MAMVVAINSSGGDRSITAWHFGSGGHSGDGGGNGNGNSDNSSSGECDTRGCIAMAGQCDDSDGKEVRVDAANNASMVPMQLLNGLPALG